MERNCFQKMLSIFLVLVLGYVPMNARADEHVYSEDDYANAAAKTAIVLSEEQSEDDSLPEPESDSVSAAELPVVAASLPEIVLPSGTCAGCTWPYSQCYSVTGGNSNWRQYSSRYPDCHVWWCAMGSKETYHELHNMNGTNGECTVCGYLHRHKSDTQWSHDEDNHWHKCTFKPCEERFDIEAHTKKEIPSVDATCTKTGLTAGMYCSVCNAVLVEQTEVDALGHDPVHHDAKAATCTEDGWDAYDTCSRCDYTTFSKISATGHQYNENHICTACDAIGGTCGEHLSWAFSTDGTLTITGSGAMVDCPLDNSSPWYAWRDSIKNLILEDGITTIGDNAFKDCTNISSVNIPYGVTKIGKLAFGNCTSLADVSIPNTVTRIDFSAFRNCSKLREIIFSGDAPEI
ncbi:MAG: leucine-rich repeat domain-containing protein [Faecousia sp.]